MTLPSWRRVTICRRTGAGGVSDGDHVDVLNVEGLNEHQLEEVKTAGAELRLGKAGRDACGVGLGQGSGRGQHRRDSRWLFQITWQTFEFRIHLLQSCASLYCLQLCKILIFYFVYKNMNFLFISGPKVWFYSNNRL
jgi:hypothetical protein